MEESNNRDMFFKTREFFDVDQPAELKEKKMTVTTYFYVGKIQNLNQRYGY